MTVLNFFEGMDWEGQGFLTLALIFLELAVLILYSWAVSIIWLVDSINAKEILTVNFYIIFGLITIVTGIFKPNIINNISSKIRKN